MVQSHLLTGILTLTYLDLLYSLVYCNLIYLQSYNLMKEIYPEESCVITSIDQAIPKILEVVLPYLPPQEKVSHCYSFSCTETLISSFSL